MWQIGRLTTEPAHPLAAIRLPSGASWGRDDYLATARVFSGWDELRQSLGPAEASRDIFILIGISNTSMEPYGLLAGIDPSEARERAEKGEWLPQRLRESRP